MHLAEADIEEKPRTLNHYHQAAEEMDRGKPRFLLCKCFVTLLGQGSSFFY
jgi:hypothetical protein